MRGTVIRHNYLHHIHGFQGRGCMGIYLDDMYCGTAIFGNVFYDVTRAAYIGGGRDNSIENNLFVDCRPSVHVDSRALGWAHQWSDDWIKEIAPSPALRKWFGHDPARFAEFGNLYLEELDGNPAPVVRLCGTLQDQDVTLVYAARDERHNHVRVLRDYLARRGCTVRKGV